MGKLKACLALFFVFSTPSLSFAQNTDPVIQYGQATQFNFESSVDHVVRINILYVPKSLEGETGKFKTLMFLHGGGTTYTADDAGAVKVASTYLEDFKPYAEKNKVILVFPTTKLGWGKQTSYFFREFIPFIESKLPINDDYFVLAGHSMGGMGITREYPYVTDLFSGVLGMAAGIQDNMITESAILPYFNGTPYLELNGKNDDNFPDFLAQEKKFNAELTSLSARLGFESNYRLDLFNGGHDYKIRLVRKHLDELFKNSKVHDPKYLTVRFGYQHTLPAPGSEGMLPIPKIDGLLDHQYWIGVSGYQDTGKTAYIEVHAQVTGQMIAITTDSDDLHPTTANLTIDQNLVDLTAAISVTVNGKQVFSGMAPQPSPSQQQQDETQQPPATPPAVAPFLLSVPLN